MTAQLDIFGGRHERQVRTVRTCQPSLFTAEHEAQANAEEWRAVMERFRAAGVDDGTGCQPEDER